MSLQVRRYHLKGGSSSNKDSQWTHLQISSTMLGIYEQQVGDQSCCRQTLQTQRFIHLFKNCCNVSSVASYLGVYLYWRGFICCQWARWETARLSSSGSNSYRGCDDRIQSTMWLLSGIQMPIPLPSTISTFSLVCHISLCLPSPLPQCLSGLVISCHPLQKQITPHTACFPSGSMHTRKTGKHTNK